MKPKEVLRLVDGLHRNKDIDKEVIFLAIESALQSAAKKYFGTERDIAIEIDRETGEIATVRGDERIDPEMLGRIAAQSAKQVIIQKIREAVSESIYEEFTGQKGTLVTGSVQRFQDGDIVVDLDKTQAVVPRFEQIVGEHFQPGERIRAIILDVKKLPQKVHIILSRAHPDFLRRMFELEVPEIEEGVVEIVKIAREAGVRAKVAVRSLDPRVDAIGACVGVRGTRIRSIIDELNGEKVDIIPWNEAPEMMIADTLRPADILKITLEEGEHTKRATVVVPEDQISLAIGRKGQNVRLAVKMSGWDIDILPPEQEETEAEEGQEAEAGEEATEAEQEEPQLQQEEQDSETAEENGEAEEATEEEQEPEATEEAEETEQEEPQLQQEEQEAHTAEEDSEAEEDTEEETERQSEEPQEVAPQEQ